MSSTPMAAGISGGHEVANKIISMMFTYFDKLQSLLDKIQEKLDQGENSYLLKCKTDITRLQSRLQIPYDEYNSHNMNMLLSLEQQILGFIDSPELSSALASKLQVADVNQGQSSVKPSSMLPPRTPIARSQSARIMHRTGNSSVDNAIYANARYHPYQKTDPPPRNAQDGLNTSSQAAASSSTMGVATKTPDHSGYASYLTANDPYGYRLQANQPYTRGPQNSGSPYQPLTSFQNSGSYAGSTSSSSISHNINDYQTSGMLSSSDYGSQTKQANLWNDGSRLCTSQVGRLPISGSPYQPLTTFHSGSNAGSASYPSSYLNTGDYQTSGWLASSGYGSQTTQANLQNDGRYANHPSHQYSGYTPADSRSALSSSTVAPTDYDRQTSSDGTCAPGTENKSTSSASTLCHILHHPLTSVVIPLIPGIIGRPISTQPPPGTTSWQPQVSSSGATSWVPDPSSPGLASRRPESTSWRPEPAPSNTTIWRPEPIPSSTTSWRPDPTSTSTMSWRPDLTSSGLLTVQGSQVTGDAYNGYWRQGPAAFQNHSVTALSHIQRPLGSFPVPYEVSHGIQHTGPVPHFPATHPGSSMDTQQGNTLQTAPNPSILYFSDDDQAEEETLSKHDQ